MNAVEQSKLLKPKKSFANSAFSRRKTLLSIGEKINTLELRKNIELSLIEDDEGKTIPIEQAFEEIRLGLSVFGIRKEVLSLNNDSRLMKLRFGVLVTHNAIRIGQL